MPDANYYREQARLLARWSLIANPDMAERLMQRSRRMAALAERAEASAQSLPEARTTEL